MIIIHNMCTNNKYRTIQPFEECFYVHPLIITLSDLKNMIYERHGFQPEHDTIQKPIQIKKIKKLKSQDTPISTISSSTMTTSASQGKTKLKSNKFSISSIVEKGKSMYDKSKLGLNYKSHKQEYFYYTKWITLDKFNQHNRLQGSYTLTENCILRYRCGLPWKKERILWIAHFKNDQSSTDINTICYLSKIPKDILLHILSFFSYSKSKVDDSIWVRKSDNEPWKECVVLYDAFNAFKVHYLNYSSYYDDWIDKSDKNNISLVNPNIVGKDFEDI